MRKIERLLEGAIERQETLRGARAWRALRHWNEIVGPLLATRSAPDRYEKGVVWVAVSGSAWSAELRMRQDDILERLRAESGDPSLFVKLRFGIRPFDLIESPTLPEPLTPRSEPTGESIREIGERLVRKLQDEGRD